MIKTLPVPGNILYTSKADAKSYTAGYTTTRIVPIFFMTLECLDELDGLRPQHGEMIIEIDHQHVPDAIEFNGVV